MRTCALALVLLCGFSSVFARTATQTRARGKRIYDTKFLDVNRWHLPFYNDGRWAIDATKLNFPGGYWPSPIKNFHLFGGGLWVGAISEANETLVTVGYNPNSGSGEFYPTMAADWEGGTGNTMDRVYKYGSSDWPPSATRYPEPGMVPTENFSLQDLWMGFSDAAPAQHVSPGKPLGLDVYLTVYAWNYPANQDIFFLTYKVKNATGDAFGVKSDLRKVIFGVCTDDDIGDATDDMVGTIINRVFNNGADTVRDVGFVGDNDNAENPSDRWERGQPGVVAMKFLESPKDANGNQLGMTAFKKFTIDIDPVTDATQYQTMAGLDYRTGIYSKYDSLDEQTGDKRIIQCSGPFELPADSIQTVVVGVMGAYYGAAGVTWPNRSEADLLELVRAARTAQFIYDKGWLLPGPPESPNVTLIPMDNKVRITWDNRSEVIPARYYQVAGDTLSSGWDPLYKEFDFQGYKVWKSTEGTSWKLLTQCDLADGDTFIDTTQADSIRIKATDSGILYSFVDDSVINGYTYYYAVTAYNHNYSTIAWTPATETLKPPHKIPADTGDIILEGGRRSVAVIPRWEPANVRPPDAYVERIAGDNTNPALLCTAKVVVPFQVTGADTYELHILSPEYKGVADRPHFRWTVWRMKAGVPTELIIDTSGLDYKLIDLAQAKLIKNDLPTVAGLTTSMKLKMGLPDSSYSGRIAVTGEYPADSLGKPGLASQGYWAYRGSDYKLEWRDTLGGARTLTVIDVTNGNIPVPYTTYKNVGTSAQYADGWCFGFANTAPSDTLRESDKTIYVCGTYISFRPSTPPAAIGPALKGMIHAGDVWQVTGYRAKKASPAYNVFRITGKPERVLMTQADSADTVRLRVRVVPNPYLIFDKWEVNQYYRRLAFIGLPAKCDIRIFNQAGDLVKVIKHTDTRPTQAGQAAPQKGELGGTEFWDLINDSQQLIATGIYIFHVKSDVGETVGKFAIVR